MMPTKHYICVSKTLDTDRFVGLRFAAALLPLLFGTNLNPRHTTWEPQLVFKSETNCFQFYAIANLDKTSLVN